MAVYRPVTICIAHIYKTAPEAVPELFDKITKLTSIADLISQSLVNLYCVFDLVIVINVNVMLFFCG